MSSHTIHVIGLAKMDEQRDAMYFAMSRVEMVQQMVIAQRDGRTIDRWYAQTRTGMRMLGMYFVETLPGYDARHFAYAHEIQHLLPKLPTCEVCDGRGCCCCKISGLARNGNARRWSAWQIEYIRAGALTRDQEIKP